MQLLVFYNKNLNPDRPVERRRISVSFWSATLLTISDKQSEKIRVWWNRNCYSHNLITLRRLWFGADWWPKARVTLVVEVVESPLGSISRRPLINWSQTWSVRLLSVTWSRVLFTPGLSTVQSSDNNLQWHLTIWHLTISDSITSWSLDSRGLCQVSEEC